MDKKRIFNRDVESMELYIGGIELVDDTFLDGAQIGFRVSEDGKEIEDWLGDAYYVIGYDSLLGDPIIVKVDEEEYPVYSMMHDGWEYVDKVANSYESFLTVMKFINELSEKDGFNKEEVLNEIKEIVGEDALDYWDTFLQTELEYLEEEE